MGLRSDQHAQVSTTACKRLFSLCCVAHTDGVVLQGKGHVTQPEVTGRGARRKVRGDPDAKKNADYVYSSDSDYEGY